MKPKGLILALVAWLAVVNFGCDIIDRLSATDIGQILDHPREYEDKEVTIYGTVTEATSMLVLKYFEIQDDTGKIKVVTDRVLPAKGEKIKVTGHTSVIEVGSERWVVLQEKSRVDKSTTTG
jgi:aspartyl/asparaginyl-tRNA synthetase